MPTNQTLGEFVKLLAVRMDEENVIMLFKDERPWHMLFYRLKKTQSAGKPDFLSALRFDWDGPYPRCQELSEFIQALHWTGSVVAANPSYDRITLRPEVKNVWGREGDTLSEDEKVFLANGLDLAKQEFPTGTVGHS